MLADLSLEIRDRRRELRILSAERRVRQVVHDAVGVHSVALDQPLPLRAVHAELRRRGDAAIQYAEADGGLTRVLAYQAAESLRAGRLKIVLASFEQPALPIHIVYPTSRLLSAKVRAFIDFCAAQMGGEDFSRYGREGKKVILVRVEAVPPRSRVKTRPVCTVPAIPAMMR